MAISDKKKKFLKNVIGEAKMKGKEGGKKCDKDEKGKKEESDDEDEEEGEGGCGLKSKLKNIAKNMKK